MKQRFLERVLRISSLYDPMASLSSLRTLCMALLMTLCISNAWADDVVSVTFDGTTTSYSKFDDAITYANSVGCTTTDNQALVTVLKNCEGGSVTIDAGKYVTISGGSYTLTVSAFTVNGNLTITDGTYNVSATDKNCVFKTASESSSLTVNGGTIDATTKSVERAIWADYGTCVINDGTIKGSKYGLYVFNASVTLNGGSFYGADGGIFAYSTSKDVSTFLSDGKKYYVLDNNGEWTVYNASGSSIDQTVKVSTFGVASVTFDGTTNYYSTFDAAIEYANSISSTEDKQAEITLLADCSGTLTVAGDKYITISGGSHTLSSPSIRLVNKGHLTIEDGTYQCSGTNGYTDFIYINNDNATLTVNGGTIDATLAGLSNAIYVYNGCCTINGGTIRGNKVGLYILELKVVLNGGSFYGGENSILLGYYTNELFLSQYLGTDKAYFVNGDNGWEQCSNSASISKIAKPVFVDNASNYVKVNANGTETLYHSFDDALTAANNAGEATITLISNCSTGRAAIPSGKNIALNGGAYTLTTSDCIYVDGNLTINDGTFVSTTTGTVNCINVQCGSLTLNGGTFSGHGGSIDVFGKTVLSALGDGKLYYDDNGELYSGNLLSEYINSQVTVKDCSSYAAAVYTGTSSIYYETFESALSNAISYTTTENPYVIILLGNCSTAGFEAPAGKGLAIYGNKYTMTLADKVQVRGDLIIGDGTFKAADSYDWKPGNVDTDDLFDVTGTLTINDGVIDANHILKNALETGNSGDVKINGGTIQGANQYALYIDNAGTGSVLNGGSLSANSSAIHVPSPMPVCYLLGTGRTFEDYYDNFFANESSASVTVVEGNIQYKRNVTSGNYGSICLPYASKSWTGVDAVYEVESVSESKITLKAVSSMVAGTPYLFKSNESSICFDLNGLKVTTPVVGTYLVGNYNVAEVPAGNYVLQNNQFCKVEAGETIKSGSYRCYFNGSKAQSSEIKVIMLDINDEDEPITEIGEDEVPLVIGEVMNALNGSDAEIYDLNGRRLQSLQKGLNIVNGKKVIVK